VVLSTFKSTRLHKPEDHNRHLHRHENLAYASDTPATNVAGLLTYLRDVGLLVVDSCLGMEVKRRYQKPPSGIERRTLRLYTATVLNSRGYLKQELEMTCQVLTAMSMKMTVFWEAAQFSLIETDRSFRGAFTASIIRAISTRLHEATPEKTAILENWRNS
jgi:hypothetical protein